MGVSAALAARDDDLDLVVAQLRRVSRDATLQFSLSVGAIVIHHFYDGDTNAWRQRGAKSVSFRRLSEREDLPFSPSLLYRCVAIFELCARLDAVSRWKHLNATHFRAVLGLPQEAQVRLLSQANQEHWTVAQLEVTAANVRKRESQRVGRRSAPRLVKSVGALARCLDANSETFHDLSDIALLQSDQIESICRQLHHLRAAIERLECQVRTRAPTQQHDEHDAAHQDGGSTT